MFFGTFGEITLLNAMAWKSISQRKACHWFALQAMEVFKAMGVYLSETETGWLKHYVGVRLDFQA